MADAELQDSKTDETIKPVCSSLSADAELQDSKKNMTAQSVHFCLLADAEFQDAKKHKTVKQVNIDLLADTELQNSKTDKPVSSSFSTTFEKHLNSRMGCVGAPTSFKIGAFCICKRLSGLC